MADVLTDAELASIRAADVPLLPPDVARRLLATLDAAQQDCGRLLEEAGDAWVARDAQSNRADAAERRARDASRENDTLRTALAPLAAVGAALDPALPDDVVLYLRHPPGTDGVTLTAGDARAAARVLGREVSRA